MPQPLHIDNVERTAQHDAPAAAANVIRNPRITESVLTFQPADWMCRADGWQQSIPTKTKVTWENHLMWGAVGKELEQKTLSIWDNELRNQ